jgi:hypothetical protein
MIVAKYQSFEILAMSGGRTVFVNDNTAEKALCCKLPVWKRKGLIITTPVYMICGNALLEPLQRRAAHFAYKIFVTQDSLCEASDMLIFQCNLTSPPWAKSAISRNCTLLALEVHNTRSPYRVSLFNNAGLGSRFFQQRSRQSRILRSKKLSKSWASQSYSPTPSQLA